MEIQIPGFRLGRVVGEGGMALVYQAIQENFDRKVAIKVLSPAMAAEQEYAERFLIEAKTVAKLQHPHIIPVYDVGKIDAHYYIAMEYLPGNTLKHWIGAGLEEAEVLQITREVADALYYAHGKGIVHRDIKSENIMFREDNSAVLTDFGIASSSRSQNNLTQEGNMIGTPAYMSPEQARAKSVDNRSDIYSLGVVFYEMLSGKQPYEADDPMGVALAHITEPTPVLPEQYKKYQGLLEQMMAKEPADRFQSALGLVKAIKQLESGSVSAVAHSESVGIVANQQQLDETTTIEHKALEAEKILLKEPKEKTRPGAVSLAVLPEKNFSVDISVVRKLLFFKTSTINIQLVCEDIMQFNVLFGQVSKALLDWNYENGRAAKIADLRIYCKPWLVEKVESQIKQLVGTKDPYGFLANVQIQLDFFDMEGQSTRSHNNF